ncbi:class I SAM-dependent methyltransferase [Caulobacter sp.]|uniref:class I SAM-dependent methyltransferase n=1 Tax=Caulobacter sp. TaxID=78 RepID=UPI003BB15025
MSRQAVVRALDSMGLADSAFALYQRYQAWRSRGADVGAQADGLPVPPAYLRVLTAGHADAEIFLSQGRDTFAEVAMLAARHGLPLEAGLKVLEFGSGCGRSSRYASLTPVELSGCDINPKLVAWTQANLPGRFVLSRQTPPLMFEIGEFDLVYAISVFTHMTDAPLRAWLAELARVVRPGGLAVLTFFDPLIPVAADFAEDLAREGFHIRHNGAEGSNLLCGYMTREGFAERAAPDWTLVDVLDSPASASGQAMAVFRRV